MFIIFKNVSVCVDTEERIRISYGLVEHKEGVGWREEHVETHEIDKKQLRFLCCLFLIISFFPCTHKNQVNIILEEDKIDSNPPETDTY